MRSAAAILLAVLALPLFAQHREEITVEVIDVPVYINRGTLPVEGLTRDDFELYVNGKPQPIDYFDVVDLGAPVRAAEGGGAPPSMRQRRLFLLLFDLTFSRPGVVARAQKAAMELVRASGTADAYAVATFSASKGIQFAVPFSVDRVAVLRALGQLRPASVNDPLQLEMTADLRASYEGFMASGFDTPAATGTDFVTGAEEGAAEADLKAQPMRRIVELQVDEIRTVVKRISQLEGQKHIVIFSEGFSPGFIISPRNASPGLHAMLQSMYKEFHAADTFLHAVDIAGLRHTFQPLLNDALRILSTETGGQFVRNENNLRVALQNLADEHRHAYMLGFRPRNPKRGYNSIEVKLKERAKGAQISYRRGFTAGEPPQAVDALKLADIVTNDLPQTGLAANIEGTAQGVKLTIPATAAAILGGKGEVEVLFYVFDAKGAVVESQTLRVPVSGEARTIDVKLPLPAGDYVAKALLRIGPSSIGFSRLPLRVAR